MKLSGSKCSLGGLKEKLGSLSENIGKNPGEANDILADLQRTMAVANPCLRAKKCQLMSKNTAGNEKSDTTGCCKGQTGHHLIPHSYFSNGPCGSKSDMGKTPTVCAEGDTHRKTNGSHGALHRNLDAVLRKTECVATGAVSYEDAREAAIESHKKTFPFSLCSRKCLRAQLDKGYKKKCKNKDLSYSKMPGGEDASIGTKL